MSIVAQHCVAVCSRQFGNVFVPIRHLRPAPSVPSTQCVQSAHWWHLYVRNTQEGEIFLDHISSSLHWDKPGATNQDSHSSSAFHSLAVSYNCCRMSCCPLISSY